jgi:hypothetical protein
MINNLPTIYEVVTGTAKKQQMKEKTPNSSTKSNKPPSKVVCSRICIFFFILGTNTVVCTLAPDSTLRYDYSHVVSTHRDDSTDLYIFPFPTCMYDNVPIKISVGNCSFQLYVPFNLM